MTVRAGAPNSCAWRRTPPRAQLEALRARTSPSGSGGRCARTTRPTATCWDYFPHDHARSRAYRWGEDGLLGICDRQGRLCFALALWNGDDPILKERLFGLTGPEGNHGEDVKELYFYLDATPTHSYMQGALQVSAARRFPTRGWSRRTARRGRGEPEFELADTGVFDDDRYFDVFAEYAKASPDDVLHRDHGRQPRARAGAAACCCRRSGSATPGRGGGTGEGY